MMSTTVQTRDDTTAQRAVPHGVALLDDPIYNKGTAFT
jgi:hypothetical protein